MSYPQSETSASTTTGSRAWAVAWGVWIGLFLAVAFVILGFIIAATYGMAQVTGGPGEDHRREYLDARTALYDSCEARFYVGVYDEPCVSLFKDARP